jgi:hypothetical protein
MSNRTSGFLALALVVVFATLAGATSVIQPTFSDLVERAQVVFVGETVAVESRWVSTSSGPVIVTLVTYKVERTLKGELGAQTTLEFLGGSVGDARLDVSGIPKFRVGDKDVIFADERGRPISPVVGFMHGRFRVLHDPASGRESMARFNFQPFASITELDPAARPAAVPSSRALTLGAFADEITRAVRRTPAQK